MAERDFWHPKCNQARPAKIIMEEVVSGGKDYPIERIYRDARITSIYEGTTQLQVVAAVRALPQEDI